MNEQQFENFIEKYEEEIRLLAEREGISIVDLKDKLRALTTAVEVIVVTVSRIANNIIEFMQSLDFMELERKFKERRQLYKLDLKRPIIRNQVIDRKPQHLIKKIIY